MSVLRPAKNDTRSNPFEQPRCGVLPSPSQLLNGLPQQLLVKLCLAKGTSDVSTPLAIRTAGFGAAYLVPYRSCFAVGTSVYNHTFFRDQTYAYKQSRLECNAVMQAPAGSGQEGSPRMMAGLRLLRAVLGSPGNPFVSDWVVVNDYAPRLFLHFARLFHDLPSSKSPITALCKAHLQVLSFIPARATPAFSAWPSSLAAVRIRQSHHNSARRAAQLRCYPEAPYSA